MLAFTARYLDLFASDALRGLNIGIYEHSTVARDLLGELLQALGAFIVRLGRSQEFLAVDTEATDPRTEEMLREWSALHRLDAIVSADGDGDRPLLTDATGTLVRGDAIGLLTAHMLGAQVIVTPVTSSSGIEREAGGAHVMRTRVGSPFVIEGMEAAVWSGSRKAQDRHSCPRRGSSTARISQRPGPGLSDRNRAGAPVTARCRQERAPLFHRRHGRDERVRHA